MKKISESPKIMFASMMEDESEFIPLLSPEEEESFNKQDLPELLPLLPLRNTVLFPGVVIPITVGRDKSIKLIKEVYKENKLIGVVSQKNNEIEDPKAEDLNNIGTLAFIIKLLQMPDGSTTVIIQGRKRIQVESIIETEPYFKAKVAAFDKDIPIPADDNFSAIISSLKDLSIQLIKLSPNLPNEAGFAIRNIESPTFLINFISSNLNIEVSQKQKLLEVSDLRERATNVLAYLSKELQVAQLKNQIQDKVKVDIDKEQRNYILHQQLKTIQEELGVNPHQQDINDIQAKAKDKKWTDEIAEKFNKELGKLQRMNPAAAEYSIQLNYLDTFAELPWNNYTEDNFDLKEAKKILDDDHYGLEKVKDRIIEHLAVYKLKGDMKSPILCLVGPPGVGKTSLGKSIARALGRKYIRMSLGGIKDESELRGHRKTYIGAMPGRILQNLKKAKSSNPVFMLDEVDKVIGYNINGDPQAALLEILDPEQNNSFYDNFLETDYDLSKVMFIATANTMNTVHQALRDRMEVIEINGYLVQEKIKIAVDHLIPKELQENGVKENQLIFSEKIIERIIEDYTRESGVRTLEKQIAKIIRSYVKDIVNKEKYNKKISEEDLFRILGSPKFQIEKDLRHNSAGVATGLAWTPVGGEILFIEVSLSKGKGNLTLTGNLGDVMKESATIAYEYLKSHSQSLGINPDIFADWNVHIHVPEGATPKDGPSAGITMFTALASAFTQKKVKEKIAMTGEITLRGKVLPVGGITEKILAAKRAKVTDIILSVENKKDIEEIKTDYVKGLKFHYISDMIDVISLALDKEKVKNPLNFALVN